MTGPWIGFFPLVIVEDDLPDSFISTARFIGFGTGTSGEVSIGVNDEDTVIFPPNTSDQTEGTLDSVNDDDGTVYKNTSGFNAIATILIKATNTGAASRHIKVYSAPTEDSSSGATLVWEYDEQDGINFDADGDLITTPPIKIQNNHFIVVENVDDSRAGTNNLRIMGRNVDPTGATTIIVERGA